MELFPGFGGKIYAKAPTFVFFTCRVSCRGSPKHPSVEGEIASHPTAACILSAGLPTAGPDLVHLAVNLDTTLVVFERTRQGARIVDMQDD